MGYKKPIQPHKWDKKYRIKLRGIPVVCNGCITLEKAKCLRKVVRFIRPDKAISAPDYKDNKNNGQ